MLNTPALFGMASLFLIWGVVSLAACFKKLLPPQKAATIDDAVLVSFTVVALMAALLLFIIGVCVK